MPKTKSAKKALRKNLRNRAHNLSYLNKIKSLRKTIKKAIVNKNKDEAKKLLPKFYKIVDKAAKEKVIKKNKAARLKSRLTIAINKLS